MSVYLYDKLPLNLGVVFDYPLFEGTGTLVRDISKNHIPGVFGAGAAAPAWTQLASGIWVLTFNGNDNVQVGDNSIAALYPPIFTWEFWVSDTALGALSAVIGTNHGSATYPWECLVSGVDSISFSMRQADTTRVVCTLTPLMTLGYKHLVFTGDGANIAGYINGAPTGDFIAYDGTIAGVGAFRQNIYLGYARLGIWWTGNKGRARLYNRALSGADVAARFQETRGFYGV